MLVRGTALRSALLACDEELGAGAADRVRAAMPEALRARLEPAILGAAWYEVEIQAAIHEAIRAQFGRGSFAANERVGHRAALDDFRGVYRVFLPLLTWDLVWTSIERAWLRYNSAGRIEIEARSPRQVAVLARDVDGYTEAMWHAIAGRLRGIVELAGGEGVRVIVERCTSERASMLVRWER